MSFAGNHLEASKIFLSRFNELALLRTSTEADKLKASPLALSGRAYQMFQTLAADAKIAELRYYICEQFNNRGLHMVLPHLVPGTTVTL